MFFFVLLLLLLLSFQFKGDGTMAQKTEKRLNRQTLLTSS